MTANVLPNQNLAEEQALAAITYTAEPSVSGPTFTCSRCRRVYAYPADHGKPIRCECGWWYYNLGHGRFSEAYKPRIGGAP